MASRTPVSRSEIVKAAYRPRSAAAGSHQTRAPWQVGLKCITCGQPVLVKSGFWSASGGPGGTPYARHHGCVDPTRVRASTGGGES